MNLQSMFDTGYRMLGAGAQGWSREMIWGGRWEGGFRIGNSCTPVEDSCQCMAKPIQYLKQNKVKITIKKNQKKNKIKKIKWSGKFIRIIKIIFWGNSH